MATILFQGEPIERHLLRQRIAADRLEPLVLPLTDEQVAQLIDVGPDTAWLPLAISLLQHLQRLWMIVSSGPGHAPRTAHEERAYLVLRSTLLGVLASGQHAQRITFIATFEMPEHLPTSGKLANLSPSDHVRYLDPMEEAESGLIELAIDLGISSDARTVESITQRFDDALDRIEHDRLRRVLDRALVCKLTKDEIQDCRRRWHALWKRITRQEDYWLAYMLQIVARIGEIWTLLNDSPSGWHRHAHDEEAYQEYRHLLLRGLDQPESAATRELAFRLLPRILPVGGFHRLDDPVPLDMLVRLQRLRSELISLAIELGQPVNISSPDQPDLDEAFEEASWAWSNFRKAALPLRPDPGSAAQPPAPTALHRNGRPRIRLTYEQAATIFWQLYEDLEGRTPSQKEICERLTVEGCPIRERALRTRIKDWIEHDRRWPPPEDIVTTTAA